MVSYLNWAPYGPSQMTAVAPFTYRDGVTYLEKLELIGDKTNELVSTVNSAIVQETSDVTAINAKYTQLVADWNATLTRLDPTQVRNIVTGYDTAIASLGTRMTAAETKNTAQDTALAAKADKTYVDAQDTATLNTAKAYTDTNLVTAKAYADTNLVTAKGYTDTTIGGLAATYETKAAVAADATSAVTAALSSATTMRNAFDSRYAAQGSVAWPAQGSAGGVYYLSAYCNATQKAGTTSASPAIAQILTEMSARNAGKTFGGVNLSGGTIIVDGMYMVDQPIAPPAGLSLIGTGSRSSGFYLSSGNFLQLGSGQWCERVLCQNFGVDIAPGAGSFLKMTGTDGNNESILTKSNFMHLRLYTKSTSQPIISVTGYSEFHNNNFFGCEIDRPNASTTYAFLFEANAGNVMNSNSLRGMWIHGHNTTGQPAIKVNATSAGWQHNWTFEDLCGEQNCAGLMRILGVNHIQIRNCVDWDGTVPNTAPVIYVGGSNGGSYSCNVFIEASGSPTSDSNVPTVITVENNTPNSYIMGCNPCAVPGKIIAGNRTRVDNIKVAYRTVSANYTVDATDETILCTAGGITITLPDPLVIPNVGTVYQVVNASGSAVTIVAANGRNVVGSASYNLPAGATISLITEGQLISGSGAAMRWLRIAGS